MDLLKQYQLYSQTSFNNEKKLGEEELEVISGETFIKSSVETNDIKKRLLIFKNVHSLTEAKMLAKEYFPTKNEITSFNVCGGKCTIVNREKMFRITFDSRTEFISYSFE